MLMDTVNQPTTHDSPDCQSHILIVEDDRGRREYLLEAPIYSIGRDPKCDIRLASQFVSRRHATLVKLVSAEDAGYYYRIVDGNLKAKPSANGILINGHKQSSYDLQSEDVIVFSPKVQAIYYILKPDAPEGDAPNGSDVTLVNPEMAEEAEAN